MITYDLYDIWIYLYLICHINLAYSHKYSNIYMYIYIYIYKLFQSIAFNYTSSDMYYWQY